MQLLPLWVPQENLSWYSVFNIYHKVRVAIEPGLLELFENVMGPIF